MLAKLTKSEPVIYALAENENKVLIDTTFVKYLDFVRLNKVKSIDALFFPPRNYRCLEIELEQAAKLLLDCKINNQVLNNNYGAYKPVGFPDRTAPYKNKEYWKAVVTADLYDYWWNEPEHNIESTLKLLEQASGEFGTIN